VPFSPPMARAEHQRGMQPLNNGHLLPSTAGRQVSVGEIQSLNG
jgi:hypothetical protein